jgi:hypothetical protein
MLRILTTTLLVTQGVAKQTLARFRPVMSPNNQRTVDQFYNVHKGGHSLLALPKVSSFHILSADGTGVIFGNGPSLTRYRHGVFGEDIVTAGV